MAYGDDDLEFQLRNMPDAVEPEGHDQKDDFTRWSEDAFHEGVHRLTRMVQKGLISTGDHAIEKLVLARHHGVEHLLSDADHDAARDGMEDNRHMADAVRAGEEIYGKDILGDLTPIGDDGREFIKRNFHDRREGRI